jgi:hypothetical protein
LPPGTIEALLVLADDVDEPADREGDPSWKAYVAERR